MALHFIGFCDDRYWNAVAIFGLPDFYHRVWDMRARQEVIDGDVAIFASEIVITRDADGAWLTIKCSPDNLPKQVSWDDSQQDIITRGTKGVHW